MKKMALISILFFMSGCTVLLRSDTKQDEKDVCIEKEFYVGPKVGKN